jgi:hypothetical protein
MGRRFFRMPSSHPPIQSGRLFGSSKPAPARPLREGQTDCKVQAVHAGPPAPCNAEGSVANGRPLLAAWLQASRCAGAIARPSPRQRPLNRRAITNSRPIGGRTAWPSRRPAFWLLCSFPVSRRPLGAPLPRALFADGPASPPLCGPLGGASFGVDRMLKAKQAVEQASQETQASGGCWVAQPGVGGPSHIGFWLASPPNSGPSNPVARLSARGSQPGSQ